MDTSTELQKALEAVKEAERELEEARRARAALDRQEPDEQLVVNTFDSFEAYRAERLHSGWTEGIAVDEVADSIRRANV